MTIETFLGRGLLLAMLYSDSAFANLFPPAKTLVSLAIDGPCVASEIVRALRVVEKRGKAVYTKAESAPVQD